MADSIFQIKKNENGKLIFLFEEVDDTEKNKIAAYIANELNQSTPGTYQDILNRIQEKHSENVLKEKLSEEDINQINSFYTQKNVSTKWAADELGAKPPTGEFDPAYYKEQVPEVAEKWKQANEGFSFAGKKIPNLDLTERYVDEDTYLQFHYTSQGKQKNIRANAAQVAYDAEYYTEKQKPVADIQAYRDQLNGLFESAESLQEYADTTGEERFEAMRQDVLKKTISKLRAAKRQEDSLEFFKAMPGVSEIYDFGSTISNELLGDSGLGGYLSMMGQSNLKEGIENMFSPGNSTVYNWQKWFDEELAEKYNPLYSEYTEASKGIDEKQKIIEAYTKRNNNIRPEIYLSENKKLVFNTATNRFDKDFLDEIGFNTTKELENFLSKNENDKKLLSLLKENPLNKYSNTDSTVIDLLNEINEEQKNLKNELSELYSPAESTTIKIEDKEYEIAKEQAQAFIEDYLKPRFDYSRSMDEFISYMDVSNDQQNVLQTQTLSNKIKDLITTQTKSYLEKLKDGNQVIGIDADYYFNTGGEKPYQDVYVNEDWETAKKYGDTVSLQRQGQGEAKTWSEWAYQYGLDLNKKDDFAKLHYELRGKTWGFDPRKDYVDQQQVAEYVSESILPYITTELGKVKNVFLDFVKPEEYLNALSSDYDFFESEDVKKLLKENDIDPDLYDPEELNSMFTEVLRTVPAEIIRKQIEELNEKKKKPTQELLGVGYIEREEDVKDVEKEESENAIYNIFKEAGFEGDKDEFKQFIGEDFSMEGMDLISEFSDFDFSDPMKSLSDLQSLSSIEQEDAESEYNKIFGEAEEKDMDFMSSFIGDSFGMGSFFF